MSQPIDPLVPTEFFCTGCGAHVRDFTDTETKPLCEECVDWGAPDTPRRTAYEQFLGTPEHIWPRRIGRA